MTVSLHKYARAHTTYSLQREYNSLKKYITWRYNNKKLTVCLVQN